MVLATMIAMGVPAFSQTASFEASLAQLAADNFSDKIAAVEALGAGGDPRAVAVLQSLEDGKLVVRKSDNAVLLGEEKGSVVLLKDPITEKDIGEAPASSLDRITINNRMRGIIRGVLGGLTLLSPSAAQRLAAARSVFRSPNEAAIPVLERAIARETDAVVKEWMELALATSKLQSTKDPAERLQAVTILSVHALPEVRGLLGSIAQSDPSPDVKDAAAKALAKIESSLAFWNGVGNVFQGLSLGSVLLLAAVGLAITFGVMGVINMAHGELVMIGAYTTFVVQELFRAYAPGYFDLSVLVAVPAAFAVAGLVGIAIERGIIRFLYGRPLETLLATWGLSLILQQAVRSLFGPTNREVGSPSWMSGSVEIGGGFVLTYNRVAIIVFSLMVLGLLMLIMRRTLLGLQMRAVTQNRAMASAMGIRTGRVDALTFGLGSGIAGMAGVALSQIDNVSPNLGQAYIVDSFMVVVFGGVGNLWGTLVGAMSLGIVNKFLEPFTGTVLGKILVLIAIIFFIQKRPRGLFALKGRAVEA